MLPHVLVTTGTITSAQLMVDRLPPHAIHQFIPVDHTAYARRFFDHWRPEVAIFVELDFWPNLIEQACKTATLLPIVMWS